MIPGVSAALRGMAASSARFDQAVGRIAAGTTPDATPDATATAAGGAALTDATVQMAVARFAFLASVRAAQASTEMVAQTIGLARDR